MTEVKTLVQCSRCLMQSGIPLDDESQLEWLFFHICFDGFDWREDGPL